MFYRIYCVSHRPSEGPGCCQPGKQRCWSVRMIFSTCSKVLIKLRQSWTELHSLCSWRVRCVPPLVHPSNSHWVSVATSLLEFYSNFCHFRSGVSSHFRDRLVPYWLVSSMGVPRREGGFGPRPLQQHRHHSHASPVSVWIPCPEMFLLYCSLLSAQHVHENSVHTLICKCFVVKNASRHPNFQ